MRRILKEWKDMNIRVHKNETRGHADYGWLNARHSFSFGEYYNLQRMGFGKLRVLNEDVIAPGSGFPEHGHENMEIVTIPLEGKLEHEDSTGGSGIIGPEEVQHMSAGSGIKHSEFNASKTKPVHVLQIWVEPNKKNIQPQYAQQKFPKSYFKNKLVKIVSCNPADKVLPINQNAFFFRGKLEKGTHLEHRECASGHGTYVFVISGTIHVEGKELNAGDAAEIRGTKAHAIKITARENSRMLAIEVPL